MIILWRESLGREVKHSSIFRIITPSIIFFFIISVADLPTIHFSDFGGRPVALPSFTGDGVYVHYFKNFYELACDSNSCSWSVLPGKAGTTVLYNTMMYLPSDYTCSGKALKSISFKLKYIFKAFYWLNYENQYVPRYL